MRITREWQDGDWYVFTYCETRHGRREVHPGMPPNWRLTGARYDEVTEEFVREYRDETSGCERF